MASALLWFWHIRGHKNEGLDLLERGLTIEANERGNQALPPSRAMIRGKALNASGLLRSLNFEEDKAASHLNESLGLFRELGPTGKQGMSHALLRLGAMHDERYHRRRMVEKSLGMFRDLGDKFGIAECLMHLPSKSNWEEHLALRREIGDLDGIANALGYLRDMAFEQGDYERATSLHEESLSIFGKLGNKWAIGFGLCMFGDMFTWQGYYEQAAEVFERSLTFPQDVRDTFLNAYALYNLGVIAWLQGDYAGGIKLITDSLAIFREVGNQPMVAGGLHALGDIALAQSDYERAIHSYNDEMVFGREQKVELGVILSFCGLGKVAWAKNDYGLAEERFAEGLRLSREVGHRFTTSYALHGLGRVAHSRGDNTTARAFYKEALVAQRQYMDHPFNWASLNSFAINYYPVMALATMCVTENQMERAARLLGAIEPVCHIIEFRQLPAERAEHDQAIAAARAALGEEAFTAAWEEGRKMSLDQAVMFALEDMEANVG